MSNQSTEISDAWYSVDGPDNDVILSTRIRLARNLVNFPFPQGFKNSDGDRVLSLVFDAFSKVDENDSYQSLLVSDLDSLGQKILSERGVIEPDTISQSSSGLVLRGDGKVSCTINYNDHIRLSSFSTGLNIDYGYSLVKEIDEKIQTHLQIAGSNEFGYLTSSIKDAGSGMKISLLVHLPAVSQSGMLDRILKEVMAEGYSVSGYYGSGMESGSSLGAFYKISTETSFADDEETQKEKINKLGKKIIDFERKVRLEIADNKPTLVRDAVYRAIAIVKYSRFIELREGIDLISKIKFGKDLGLLTGIDDNLLFALLYRIQNSHLSYVIKSSDLSYEKDVSTEELKIERLRSLILQESFTTLQVTA